MINKYLTGAILWALLILVLTLTPGKSVPDYELFSYDKLGHAFIFFVQAYLLSMGLYTKFKDPVRKRNSALIGIFVACIFGFLIELIQRFIPDRSMDIYDAIANVGGSFLCLPLFYISNKLKA